MKRVIFLPCRVIWAVVFSFKFAAFVCGTHQSTWIYCGPMRLYARLSLRLVDRSLVMAIDIASVEVDDWARGAGLFETALRIIERQARVMHGVYVENVHNPRLTRFLIARGYSLVDPISNAYADQLWKPSK